MPQQDEKPPAKSAAPTHPYRRIKSPYESSTPPIQRTVFQGADATTPEPVEPPRKRSFMERLGLAIGIGVAVLPAPNPPPPPWYIVNVQPADPLSANLGIRQYPAPSFTAQPLSDGEIERLIQSLTPAIQTKPTPEHVGFARSFFRELHDIVIDPGKFAADEVVSAVIGAVVEEIIEVVRKKKGGAGEESEQANNPIIAVFIDGLIRVVDQFRPTSAGVPARTIGEIAKATGLSLAETEAVLRLARFHRSEDGIYWILPTGSC